jgi:hypothetical protein
MKIKEIIQETTAGATSSVGIATVANPGFVGTPKNKNKKKKGIAKNALDTNASLFGGKTIKRNS